MAGTTSHIVSTETVVGHRGVTLSATLIVSGATEQSYHRQAVQRSEAGTMARRGSALLGRDREMELLRNVLADVTGGRSRFVIVTGEAGIGKSRLLEALQEAGDEVGCLRLSGRAAEFESDVPFAVVIDAIDTCLRSLDQRDVDRLSADRLGALAAVFPAMATLGSAVDVPVNAAERFRVHRAVVELIERLAARQPVMLVLDDLQWADPASLELAAHLTRRPPDGAVMVAFGVRSGAMPSLADRALAAIEMADHVIRLDLPPLSATELAAVVDIDLDAARDLHELTRGNPFFAIQLARAGIGGRRLEQADVPAEVRRAILVELDAVPGIAREVVAAAAVVGDPFDLDLVTSATQQSAGDVLVGLDHLCVQGVVRATEHPRTFQFNHPLVRSAIYQAMPPGTRIATHGRIAEYLLSRDAAPVDLARHVEHSARHGDMASVEILGRAAATVVAQAPVSAARWITTALSLLPASAPPERRIRLLGDLAVARAAVGDIPGGLNALRQSLALVPAGHHVARTNVAIACAEGERLLGRPEVAAATLRRAYEQLDDVQSREGARLAVAMSSNALYLGAYDDMVAWAMEAERVADRLGEASLIVAALAARTAGAAFSGQIALALESHAELRPLLDAVDDDELAVQLDMLCGLSSAEVYLDLYDDAYAHCVRGLAIARRTGQTHLMPILTPAAGASAMVAGNFDAAAEILDDAVESARLIGSNEAVLAWHLTNRALLDMMIGDLEAASASTAESWRLASPLGDGLIRAWSAAVRADYLREAGQPAEALATLHSGAGGDEVTLIGGGWRGLYLELQVQCHLDLGDSEAARAAAARARALADHVPLHIAAMAADRAEALAVLDAGDARQALRLARAARGHAEAIRSPIHMAICDELTGRALATSGDVDAAATALVAASDGYDALGATRYRDHVDAQLRRLGRTVHRRTRSGDRSGGGLASLTGREREVADLICGRATNRDIASGLFLSMKTVETHVRNIFNKLGVSSRAEIARVVAAVGADT